MCACCIELQERDQYIFQGENKLRHFLDRELQLVEAMGQASRLGKARRPSAMARTGKEAERHGQDRLGGRAPRLVQARRPSAMVRTGKEAERHGQDRQGGRAPWLVQARRRAPWLVRLGGRASWLGQALSLSCKPTRHALITFLGLLPKNVLQSSIFSKLLIYRHRQVIHILSRNKCQFSLKSK